MKGDHKLHLISAFLWEPLLYRLKERLRNCFAAAGCCDPPPKSDKRREVAGDTVCPFWSCWCYRCCDPPRMLWSTQGNLRPRVTMEKRKLETKSVPFDVVIHHPLLFFIWKGSGTDFVSWDPASSVLLPLLVFGVPAGSRPGCHPKRQSLSLNPFKWKHRREGSSCIFLAWIGDNYQQDPLIHGI